MSVCEPVSRDSLLGNFLQMPSGYVDNLRSLIVGPDYAYRGHNATTGANFIGDYDESTGVTAAWPDLQSGEVVDLTTAVAYVVDALAAYFQDTAVVPGATEGEQNGSFPNEVIHDGGATIWSGSGRTINVITDVVVGDFVRLDDTLGNVLETRVKSLKFTGSNQNILELEDSLPAALTGGVNFNITVAEIVPSYTVPTGAFTVTTTQVSILAALTITTDRTAVAVPVIGATGYSDGYVDYRALRTTSSAVLNVISISSPDELDTYFVGWEDPQSVLGFAVARALAPVLTPPATDPPAVLFTAVASDDTTGWNTAATRVVRRNDWYTAAPLTSNTAIQQLFYNMLTSRNNAKISSRMVIALELITEEVLVSGAGNTVTVDQSLTPGFNRTVLRDGGIASPFAGTISGDIVQIAGVNHVIDTRISDQAVTLVTSAVAGAGQVLNSVIHPMSIQEQADSYATRAAAYEDRAVSVVFPPSPTWEGSTVEGYHLAAATAGLRGYTMPHQTLRGVLLETGWGTPQSAYEFIGQLDTLATGGVFVYETCDLVAAPNAVVYAPNTTDQTATVDAREGLVANADAITRYVNDAYGCYVGRAKVTFGLFAELRTIGNNALEFLRANTIVSPFGSTLLSYFVSQPRQDTNLADVVIIPIEVTISATLAEVRLNITIVVSTPDTVALT